MRKRKSGMKSTLREYDTLNSLLFFKLKIS